MIEIESLIEKRRNVLVEKIANEIAQQEDNWCRRCLAKLGSNENVINYTHDEFLNYVKWAVKYFLIKIVHYHGNPEYKEIVSNDIVIGRFSFELVVNEKDEWSVKINSWVINK